MRLSKLDCKDPSVFCNENSWAAKDVHGKETFLRAVPKDKGSFLTIRIRDMFWRDRVREYVVERNIKMKEEKKKKKEKKSRNCGLLFVDW